MPLDNNNFSWRPNDNGPLTNLRYDLEASKWVNSVNKAQNRLPSGNIAGDLGFIGAVLTLPLCLLIFIVLLPVVLIKEVIGYNIKLLPGDEPTGWVKKNDIYRVDYTRANELKAKHERKKRKTQWEDLTEEEQKMVRFVQAETAKLYE